MTLPSLNGVPNLSPTLIERRDHVAGEATGFRQDRIDRFLVEIAIKSLGQRGFQAGGVLKGESDIGDRRAVGHGR